MTEQERINFIKGGDSQNEAQEIVNADLNKRLATVEGVIEISGVGTRVSINEETNYIPKIVFNGEGFTDKDFKVTVLNCGTSTEVM